MAVYSVDNKLYCYGFSDRTSVNIFNAPPNVTIAGLAEDNCWYDTEGNIYYYDTLLVPTSGKKIEQIVIGHDDDNTFVSLGGQVYYHGDPLALVDGIALFPTTMNTNIMKNVLVRHTDGSLCMHHIANAKLVATTHVASQGISHVDSTIKTIRNYGHNDKLCFYAVNDDGEIVIFMGSFYDNHVCYNFKCETVSSNMQAIKFLNYDVATLYVIDDNDVLWTGPSLKQMRPRPNLFPSAVAGMTTFQSNNGMDSNHVYLLENGEVYRGRSSWNTRDYVVEKIIFSRPILSLSTVRSNQLSLIVAVDVDGNLISDQDDIIISNDLSVVLQNSIQGQTKRFRATKPNGKD